MTPISDKELATLLAELSATPSTPSPPSMGIPDLVGKHAAVLLQSIPEVEGNSRKALAQLVLLLSVNQAQPPILDLLRYYSVIRESIPEDAKAGRDPAVTEAAEELLNMIHSSYDCLSDLIEDSNRPALVPSDGTAPVTHGALKRSVENFRLPLRKDYGARNPVVAIALPNGPLLAATCISVTAHFSAAPINAAVGPEQFRADVEQVGAKCIVTTPEVSEKLGLTDSWVAANDIEVVYVHFTPPQELALTTPSGDPLPTPETIVQPNKSSDICLLLFTSGTSGKKKIVPLTLHLVVFGAMLVIDSWGLTSSDICLNMMPLFHIGGLLRNVFAPILAGGSTICCPAFDPGLFWSVVERIRPTWYYASPTMHSLILSTAPSSHDSRFRLICNAAGGLLPSLALQLQGVFGCTVLPSYGMTECMPISTPPLSYNLDRSGTSGVSTGPDLAILDPGDGRVPPDTVGRICVRADPVFHGYLGDNGDLDRSPFTKDGWFDTGDMGYLDSDGYLYVTGRSKEVINRGGEIISPFEVENSIIGASKQRDSPIFGRVKEALAFSAHHDVLQEIVGVVLVASPGTPRVDLRVLHDALRSSLQQAKWPGVIVYMDGLPKRNNKVLRIRLAERMSLPTFTDDTPFIQRHLEAICPPDETALTEKIVTRMCSVDDGVIVATIKDCLPDDMQLDIHIRHNHGQGTLEAVTAPIPGAAANTSSKAQADLENALVRDLVAQLDNYLIPHRIHWLPQPLPRLCNHATIVDVPMLEGILRDLQQKDADKLRHSTEGRVVTTFARILQCDPLMIRPDIDFFSLGGDSLKAGKLIAALRSEFNVSVPISTVFNDGTVSAITEFVEENVPGRSDSSEERRPPGWGETYSSTRWWLLLLQLVPMVAIYPFRRALQWTFFMVALGFTQTWVTNSWIFGRLFNLTACIIFSQLLLRLIIPWAGILAKWVIIGRYKEGLYPMWGSYHTRWWMVQKIVSVCGLGFFGWSSYTRVLYYRLMGAKIGKNVSMSKVRIGEWDLVEIQDGAVLEGCTCRPFGVEWNTTMYLGRIIIGRGATVGVASIVAPGTEVPENTCIGPNSSSWELQDASEENRDLLSDKRPGAHWVLTLFGTLPLLGASWIISLLPWLTALVGLVITAPQDSVNPLYSILNWFAAAHRVGFHYLALVARAAMSPFIAFGFAVVVRWLLDGIFGKLGSGPAKSQGHIAAWRADLMRALMPTSKLHDMTEMMGQHYEGTSVAVRLLGGKVGKRVYWPGTGPSISNYHLVNIGDDVVFGSRSHFITSDNTGAEPISLENNTMIADRVCLLPGVHIGDGATMGSGALTRRNKSYTPGATYVGSKGGDAICLTSSRKPTFQNLVAPTSPAPEKWSSGTNTPELQTPTSEKWSSGASTPVPPEKQTNSSGSSTIDLGETNTEETESTPFGRAYYLKRAPYHVLGPWAIFFYSSSITVFTKFYWNVPSISSIQITNLLFRQESLKFGKGQWYDPLVLLGWTTLFVSVITTLQAIFALVVVIASKWILLGRREPGNYDWDKSSYCQRWQIFLAVERLRRSSFRGHGILGMLTSTHWVVLYMRAMGAKVGRDCALFANGDPSLYFTEPDLLTLGDRVAVDDASLVGHINTRGKFDLNRLSVGDRCVLRTGSRLLSGAQMERDSCLLEHTLVMAGDVVEEGDTVQGWPGGVFRGSRVKESIRACLG
ncbi:related to coenzyme a synthetase [Cephalotrichum gorgonifer]|uniref:Related to coenzyme a synthetase n=1 Tax=Cephalotrichum gorgonifer TaxID=2041049 RepID=A0AAE8N8V0_9PEZI|nr:related to coenzyme a synthetase [Cephalotrichum gorgonifer]